MTYAYCSSPVHRSTSTPHSPASGLFLREHLESRMPARTAAMDRASFTAALLGAPSVTGLMLSAESLSLSLGMHFVKAGDTAGMADGFLRMLINGGNFVESEPGLFRDPERDLAMSLETDADGRLWIVSGVLASAAASCTRRWPWHSRACSCAYPCLGPWQSSPLSLKPGSACAGPCFV